MVGKCGANMRENELAVGCAHLSAEIALLKAIANRTCYYATAVSDIIFTMIMMNSSLEWRCFYDFSR